MAKIVIGPERCKACGLCISVCPKAVIAFGSEFNSKGYNYISNVRDDECISCGLCATMCPEAAIEVYKEDKKIAGKPIAIADQASTYCPGCSHGIVQRIIAEILEEEGLIGETVGITPIGCSIFIYRYMDIDFIEGAHGRAPAVATGAKRAQPDKLVFTYQGDGDVAAIGISEVMHAAIRNENISVIFVNNGNFGMTGGQTAPTTLVGQITASSPRGKSLEEGIPVHMCEIISSIGGDYYLARGSANNPRNIKKVKEYIRKAFKHQRANLGFSMVEVLGTCPSNWKMSAVDSLRHIEETMMSEFPLGEFKMKRSD